MERLIFLIGCCSFAITSKYSPPADPLAELQTRSDIESGTINQIKNTCWTPLFQDAEFIAVLLNI